MSWDVILLSKSKTIESLNGNNKPSLGNKDDVVAQLLRLFPTADFSDRNWGVLEQRGFSIQFNLGASNDITELTLHVRGDDRVVKAIQQICEHTGWQALDCSTNDLIDFAVAFTSIF